MTRAAAILAELDADPELAAQVAADIRNLTIARGWTMGGYALVRPGLVARPIPVASIERHSTDRWLWAIHEWPVATGSAATEAEAKAAADAELLRRGWRLL